MQEIKKRRIVIASVLKPVNDPRMYEKMGQSLSHQYEVHIFGTKANTDPLKHNVFFHSLSAYRRLSVDRLLSPLKILKEILRLKPSLIIICTHELLWMVLAAKIFVRCRVIYDIRENYFRNILYTNAFPAIIRIFIGLYVRIKEWITAPFIDRFFLAEAGYARELRFINEKFVVLENKLKKLLLPAEKKWSADDHNIHLLFSGTLAPTTGVLTAIELAKNLHALDEKIRLHIVGFSPMHSVRREIKDNIRGVDFIDFPEYLQPVPHTEILHAIQKADIGIIAYPPNRSTENTIPTKLFEYLGYSLPMLLIDHPVWTAICRPFPAAITFSLAGLNPEKMLHDIKTTRFYASQSGGVFWDTEEKKLLQTVSEEMNKIS